MKIPLLHLLTGLFTSLAAGEEAKPAPHWEGPNALTGTRKNIVEENVRELFEIMGLGNNPDEMDSIVQGFVQNQESPLTASREMLTWAKLTDPFIRQILKNHNIYDDEEESYIRQWVFSEGPNKNAMRVAISFLKLGEIEQIEKMAELKHAAHQVNLDRPSEPSAE